MELSDAETVFRALADARRLRILHLLRRGEACVGDLVTILELSQPTVSRQLAVLRDAGLVTARDEGPWRHYRLADRAERTARPLLETVAATLAEEAVLEADARRARALHARGGCCPRHEAAPAAGTERAEATEG